MMPRHCTFFDATAEAISHNEVVTGPPFFYEFGCLGKVVTVIGVTSDNEVAAGLLDSLPEGAAVSLYGGVNDPSSMRLSDLGGAIGRTVVGDDDFAMDPVVTKSTQSLVDANSDGLGFVEARNNH